MLLQNSPSMSSQLKHSKEQSRSDFGLRIFLSGSTSGITDYQSLQQFGTIDWKIQRLLWIGYTKNVDNRKCPFATLPKDVISYIIKFFLIDDKNDNTSRIVHFSKSTTFKDIADKYCHQLDENVIQFFENNPRCETMYCNNLENAHVNQYPFVRLWCQFGCIEKCYPTDRNGSYRFVSKEQLYKSIKDTNFNRKKWVEIPDDCLGARLDHKRINLIDYSRIVVEFLQIDLIQCEYFHDDAHVSSLDDTPLYWPLAKPSTLSVLNINEIEIGDLVDVLVECIFILIYSKF